MTDDIKQAPLHDLLRGIEDRAPKPPHQVAKWLEAMGYQPGSTRQPAQKLYDQFCEWWRNYREIGDPTHPVPIKDWALEMGRRFKKGRGRSGNFYYIVSVTVVAHTESKGKPG